MPHPTSVDSIPVIDARESNEVWDDPRSLTTFRTFHQSNGNGSFAETSFRGISDDKSKDNVPDSSPPNGHSNGTIHNGGDHDGMKNDARFADSILRNNLASSFSKLKSSPKFCNLVNPTVTPPQDFGKNVGKFCVPKETKPITVKKLSLSSFGSQLINGDAADDKDAACLSKNDAAAAADVANGASQTDETEEASLVEISLTPSDKRFGFSVVGGSDEGFSPRIEHITPGSPADRADLEVGDEILEVNGRSLDNCTHTEVISHIHQCIRSRTICLRVKRKTSCKLALDLARNSNVQDAFVIAVEQQARERLEKLSALKKIKPVDMTKLSQELNECRNSTPELNGVIENNPIYVTTVPEIHNATLERVKKDRLDNYVNSSEAPSAKTQTSHAVNGHGHIGIVEHDIHDQELELKQEIFDRESCDEVLSPLSPEAPPKERLLVEPPSDKDSITTHFSQECVSVETLLPNLPDKNKTSSSESLSHRTVIQSKHSPVNVEQNLLDKSKPGSTVISNVHPKLTESHFRPHREMAVDVPDSFVGVAKSTPRYPPHKSETSELKKEGQPEFFMHSTTNSSSVENDPKLLQSKALNIKNIDKNLVPRLAIEGSVIDDKTREEQERIRKYQEDIRKRKIAEEKQAKEDEFLRNSLRGSKKLQALEANPPQPPKHGVVNTAFELEDGDSGSLSRKTSGRLTRSVKGSGRSVPELAKTFGASELLQSLYRISSNLKSNGRSDSDLLLVEGVIRNADFQSILRIHNKVQEVCCFKCPPSAVSSEAQDTTQEVINILQQCPLLEAAELVDILSKFEMEGLIYAHDKIAERQAITKITPDEELLDRASQYTEESVKIVRIDKTNEPLGATVRNEGEAVVIGRIVKGGAAEKSGLLHEGDEILEVNGVEMRGKSVNDVCDILATMNGTLTFLIIPTQQEPKKRPMREVVVHVKAHFDYDPDDDLYIPCRELGISFQKGDILHVISQEDPNWWQAFREGEEDQALAGLVPSKSFQQQRESMKQSVATETVAKEKPKKGKFLCAKKYHKKKRKKMYNANQADDYDADQILTYEEVALYYPRANRKRPIVLIGPPNIGRHELRQRLMEDTERFAAAVPHTSRSKRDQEIDGTDYHFISRSQFEADIVSGKFVEHGEYEKNYYGTSLDAIRTVVNSGKICVLNLHPQSLKILKNSDLKPYVVFVAPPSLEKLRQNRLRSGDNPKDEELKEIIEKAREMEDNFGHYFDMVIINLDIDKAFNELLKEINTLEREPQWVPATWLKNDTN